VYQRCFIAGSVATKQHSQHSADQDILIEDCVKSASVELYQNSSLIAQTTTDAFGDYRFDGLPENSGSYQIKITNTINREKDIINEPQQNESSTDGLIEVTLGKSCFAGIAWI